MNSHHRHCATNTSSLRLLPKSQQENATLSKLSSHPQQDLSLYQSQQHTDSYFWSFMAPFERFEYNFVDWVTSFGDY
jgi:hypothetical protein